MKKIIVSSDSLKVALKKVGQSVGSNKILPVLQNVLCRVSTGSLELITSMIELTIAYRIDAETGEVEPFEFLLPFDYLIRIASEIKNAPLTIELAKNGRSARIICDTDVYEVNSLDKVEEFPAIQGVPKKNVLKLGQQFVKAVKLATDTTSPDEKRPFYMVCLDLKASVPCIVSTDANCLYRQQFPDLQSELKEKLLISPRMAKAIEDADDLDLSWTQKIIVFKTKNFTVWGRIHDGVYPNYELVIPDYPANLDCNKEQLRDALKKSMVTSTGLKTTKLLLAIEDGVLHFETIDRETSRRVHLKIPGVYTGSVESFAINPAKLLTLLDQIESDEVKLHINDPAKAMLITAVDDPHYKGLLMPVMMQS